MKVRKRFEKYTYEPVPNPRNEYDSREIEVAHCEACNAILSKMERYHDYYDGWKPLTCTVQEFEIGIYRPLEFPEGFDSWSLCRKCNESFSDDDLKLFSRNVHILESIERAKQIRRGDRRSIARLQDKISSDFKKLEKLIEYHRAFVALAEKSEFAQHPEETWNWQEIQVTEK